MGAAISQFVSEYYLAFLEDPLQFGAPIVFLASVGLLLVLVVRRIIDDRQWAPQRQRKLNLTTGRRFPKYKEVNGHRHIHYPGWANNTARELIRRSGSFYALMNMRRSVRMFSERPVPRTVIENCIRTAGTAPSGAHQQPWRFVVIEDPHMKHDLRVAAEAEEEVNYSGRMNDQWLNALAPIGTDADKSYYDKVPYIIVIFKITHSYNDAGEKQPHYYFERSVGIAAGMLIAAIHEAGLCTLTHTPTPMGFLTKMLDRPSNEKPYLMLPVGYPADDCYVPNLQRKPLEETMIWRVESGSGGF